MGKQLFMIYPKSGKVRALQLTCPIGQLGPSFSLSLWKRYLSQTFGPSFCPSSSLSLVSYNRQKNSESNIRAPQKKTTYIMNNLFLIFVTVL